MKILESYNNFKYKVGDKVLTHYWYNNKLVPVIILEKTKSKFLISHNIDESPIYNAPNEYITKGDIVDFFRK